MVISVLLNYGKKELPLIRQVSLHSNMKPKQIAILGSTGSIGRQALDVIGANPDRFEVYAISANNSVDLLIQQARRFHPEIVCIANEQHYEYLRDALADMPLKVFAGNDAIAQMVTMPSIDIVLASMVGYAGLRPTIEAIKARKTIALANKETLVVAGELICNLAAQYNVKILPVDSEHSAIFQSLVGESNNRIEKILLTASGGPFRTLSLDQLQNVSAAQALKHPNWDMGAKITIDSASMMNKGFEVIEAKWLFGVEPEQIEVLIHPQSIIHSMVQFEDGTVKAQLGMPDMRLPIQYAFTFPKRTISDFPRIDFVKLQTLTFEKPDLNKFPNLALAYEAINKGGNMPCALNAANEIVNEAFRNDQISFVRMSEILSQILEKTFFINNPSYEDYVLTDKTVRQQTLELL